MTGDGVVPARLLGFATEQLRAGDRELFRPQPGGLGVGVETDPHHLQALLARRLDHGPGLGPPLDEWLRRAGPEDHQHRLAQQVVQVELVAREGCACDPRGVAWQPQPAGQRGTLFPLRGLGGLITHGIEAGEGLGQLPMLFSQSPGSVGQQQGLGPLLGEPLEQLAGMTGELHPPLGLVLLRVHRLGVRVLRQAEHAGPGGVGLRIAAVEGAGFVGEQVGLLFVSGDREFEPGFEQVPRRRREDELPLGILVHQGDGSLGEIDDFLLTGGDQAGRVGRGGSFGDRLDAEAGRLADQPLRRTLGRLGSGGVIVIGVVALLLGLIGARAVGGGGRCGGGLLAGRARSGPRGVRLRPRVRGRFLSRSGL